VAVARVPAEKATNNPYKGVYIIPEQVYYDGANYQVTAIADSAFFQSKATEVQVPNTVTTIGECAFAYATDLANITSVFITPNSIGGILCHGIVVGHNHVNATEADKDSPSTGFGSGGSGTVDFEKVVAVVV